MRRMVLVIDDDRDTNESISDLLSGEGYSCVSALDSQRALALLSQYQPDVILLDLFLGDVSGVEFLRRKGEARRHVADIPVVVITAVTPVPKLDNVVAVLRKPFEWAELLAVVTKLAPVEKPAA